MPGNDVHENNELLEAKAISEIRAMLGLANDDIDCYGNYKAKFAQSAMERLFKEPRRGKLILTTAMTPTKAGEGKTTVAIGLAEALFQIGRKSIVALRQPSMGPVFGQKGGATGGGRSRVVPSQDINLHFTGDFHAVAAANNLLAAIVDNHIFQGNKLDIDPESIMLRRVLDVNDRALRSITVEVGNASQKRHRATGFDITAASEVMAVLCLCTSLVDLKLRLASMVVGKRFNGSPVTAGDLQAANAMCALLADAFRPNLVQTLEGTPAIIHGGPFANIAHGCSSIVATQLSLRLADYVVTEAGFGADLGFEKYCDLVAATNPADLTPAAVVLVATIKALKYNGGAAASSLAEPNSEALMAGLPNLEHHINIVRRSGLPFVVALNVHREDLDDEVRALLAACIDRGYPAVAVDVWNHGGDGAIDLASAVVAESAKECRFHPFYDRGATIRSKLAVLAEQVYGASGISYAAEAEQTLDWLEVHGYGRLPICVAKTQYSLSDDPHSIGAPTNFVMHVSDLHLSAGAGFVVIRMGEISTMPGLPAHPKALLIDVDEHGHISNVN